MGQAQDHFVICGTCGRAAASLDLDHVAAGTFRSCAAVPLARNEQVAGRAIHRHAAAQRDLAHAGISAGSHSLVAPIVR
jgi:hypothetical protein